MDISFIIPMLHDYPQIIMTVNSIQAEMAETGLKYEINVVENGEVDPYTEKFLEAYRVPISRKLINYYFEPVQCGPAARWKAWCRMTRANPSRTPSLPPSAPRA